MKIITFSDLHLEFGIDFAPPADSTADVKDNVLNMARMLAKNAKIIR